MAAKTRPSRSRRPIRRTRTAPRSGGRPRQRELRRAESRDEIAAAQPARFLHRFQNRIHDAESARDGFGSDGFACEHAVAGEQLLRDCRRPAGGVVLCRRDRLRNQPPSPLGRGRYKAPRPERRRFGTPCSSPRGTRPRERAQSVERVVRHDALPRQVPQHVNGLSGISAAGGFCLLYTSPSPRDS